MVRGHVPADGSLMDWFGLAFDSTLPQTVMNFFGLCVAAGLTVGGVLTVLASVLR